MFQESPLLWAQRQVLTSTHPAPRAKDPLLHDFVRADQHWLLRQTVRCGGHVRADLKHVTARQFHRDSFPSFLVLDERVVLIQNDPARSAHHLASRQDWLRDLQHLHVHTCCNPVDIEVHSLLARLLVTPDLLLSAHALNFQ